MEKNCVHFMKSKRKVNIKINIRRFLKMKMKHKERSPMIFPGEDPSQHVYDEFYETMMKHLIKNVPQQELAAIMLAIAVRLYRTVLTDQAFNELIQDINDTAINVRPFFDDRTIN